ncbi:MAG: RNA polymerase sigma factor [Chitinophagaceae bacterium]
MNLPSVYPESDLIVQLKSKDEQAFSYLYDHYSAALYGVIMKIVNLEETSQDILQEVFVKIWRNMESYDPAKGKLFTWMLNVARNTAIDTLRSKSFKNDKKIQELGDNVHSHNLSQSVTLKVDHLGLKKVLESLKEEQRIIIDLAYFKGYTQEEIAKELDMPLGTVKTRIRKALMQLRNILK